MFVPFDGRTGCLPPRNGSDTRERIFVSIYRSRPFTAAKIIRLWLWNYPYVNGIHGRRISDGNWITRDYGTGRKFAFIPVPLSALKNIRNAVTISCMVYREGVNINVRTRTPSAPPPVGTVVPGHASANGPRKTTYERVKRMVNVRVSSRVPFAARRTPSNFEPKQPSSTFAVYHGRYFGLAGPPPPCMFVVFPFRDNVPFGDPSVFVFPAL